MPQKPLFASTGTPSRHDFETEGYLQTCQKCGLSRERKARAKTRLPGELLRGVKPWPPAGLALSLRQGRGEGRILVVQVGADLAWLGTSFQQRQGWITETCLTPPCPGFRPDWQHYFAFVVERLLEATWVPCNRCNMPAGAWCQASNGGLFPGLHSTRLGALQHRLKIEEVTPWVRLDGSPDEEASSCVSGTNPQSRAERSQSELLLSERLQATVLPTVGKQLADLRSTPEPPTIPPPVDDRPWPMASNGRLAR
jgi:hypothetical protein